MCVDGYNAVCVAVEDSYPDAVWVGEELPDEVAVAVEC